MIASIALIALAGAQLWTVRTQTNLLRQPEVVAELPETPEAPSRYLKFSCSVLSGPVFEIGLGPRSFEDFTRFTADDAATNAPVALAITPSQGPPLSVSARPAEAQITAHAFIIGGGEAVAAAQVIAGTPTVTIAAPTARSDFISAGAQNAIGHVLDACPFKG